MAEKSTKKAKSAATLEAWDIEAAQAAGVFGRLPDPTPNSNYTMSMSDAPTPETDDGLAEQARQRMAELAR